MNNSKRQLSKIRSMFKLATPLLCLPLLTLVCMGCVIGTKAERTTVFVSPVPIPQAAMGAVMVAENKPINLTIIDKEGYFFKQSIGGYVVCDPWFYDLLLKEHNELAETKQMAGYREMIALNKLKKD